MSIPALETNPDGTLTLGTSVRLADGRRRPLGMTFDAENLAWLAERLDLVLRGQERPDVRHTRGRDVIEFGFGGTDWAPNLLVLNWGPLGGSLFLGLENAPLVVLALSARAAALR